MTDADKSHEALRYAARAMRNIIDNDQTYYAHHQPRRDGRLPDDLPGGGSIFLTPREMARAWFELYGAVAEAGQ